MAVKNAPLSNRRVLCIYESGSPARILPACIRILVPVLEGQAHEDLVCLRYTLIFIAKRIGSFNL